MSSSPAPEISEPHGKFPAMIASRDDGDFQVGLQEISLSDLPQQGPILIEVDFSSLNYKDALAITDRGRILRTFPIVPGVDLAGRVVASDDPRFEAGDRVVANGRGLGEDHWGGYARYTRVEADWITPLPDALSLEEAMVIGCAGYTAMLCMMTLEEQGHEPGDGEIVVTGASGGVGSVAVALLAAAGHRVAASTGRLEQADYLRELGAESIIDRHDLSDPEPKALDSERWAGAVDNAGGRTLSNLISRMQRHGTITSCGLAGGAAFESTVFPFILRGVNLMGIDSNFCPVDRRIEAWERLSKELPRAAIDLIRARTIGLEELQSASLDLFAGKIRGRAVVDLRDA